jgi:hypothetical protein
VGHGVSDLGELYVVCGGGTAGSYLASDVAAATFTADDYGDLQSHAVASDDVDQDGAGDLFVSAGAHLFGFLGPLSGAIASSDADVRWDPDVSWGSLGYEGLALGNVDADKLPDVIMTGTNGVYVQTSPASGVIDVTSLPSFAGGTDRYFGHSLAVVPDWNGDDASEIVVGSLDPAGGAYVFDSGTLY